MEKKINNSLIIFGVVMLICALVYFLGVSAKMKDISDTNIQIAQKQKEIADINAQIKELPALKRKYYQVLEELRLFIMLIPNEKELGVLLKQIELILLEEGINVESITLSDSSQKGALTKTGAPATPTANQPAGANKTNTTTTNPQNRPTKLEYEKAEFKMKISGTFTNIMEFLTRMKNMPRLVTLSDIKLTSAEGKVNGDITANFYINLQGGSVTNGQK